MPLWVKPGVCLRDETGPRETQVVWHVRALVDDYVVMRTQSAKSGSGWLYVCESIEFFNARANTLRIVRESANSATT